MIETQQSTGLSPEARAERLETRRQQLIDGFNAIPFIVHVGAKLIAISEEEVRAEIAMAPHLVGNTFQQILHGGVIATLLDSVAGVASMAAAYGRLKGQPTEEKMRRLAQLGTIDMRIDYLRPGRGERFIAGAKVLRIGSKICATQMTFHNEKDLLIATGNAVFHY
ncbi:MAG: thioesterase family protein [Paraperlucidibaca sp.]